VVAHSFLQAIGRLSALEQLVTSWVWVIDVQHGHSNEPVLEPHEIPFPALRQLTISFISQNVDNSVQDTLYALCGVTALRSMIISDSKWLHRLLPHITPHLVSCGNFSHIHPDTFHRFVEEHTALQDLTLYLENSHASSYLSVNLNPNELPHFRSFSGPFILYPKVFQACPVTRLALGCHLRLDFHHTSHVEPMPLSPSMLGLTVFPHSHLESHNRYLQDMDDDKPDDWTSLKTVGSSVHELFLRVKWHQAISDHSVYVSQMPFAWNFITRR
jgi:hypothetical protein